MVEVYTTAPASVEPDGSAFRRRLAEVTRWTDAAGHTGLLVYSDNTLIDPWLIAQLILERAARAVPLVAVQPVYCSPYAAARMAATLTFLHGRPVHLNLVTGGSRQHLEALGDGGVGHDERYERLSEFATVLRQLLESPRPVTSTGRHYRLQGASLPHRPRQPPRLVLSGSSEAAVKCADDLGVLRFAYPVPVRSYPAGRSGIRLGVIARPTAGAAWKAAHDRFPGDPLGERRHRVVAKLSDSHWYAELAEVEASGVYWLHPFRTYRTFCPYLVGSYAEVGAYLAAYFARGVESVILDVPDAEDDLHHARLAFDAAG
ncbi:LLM class flavin-dependent oxidoreductase [Dactylosporangium vinaceum]|uniref:LLM class flavin-dependent oxidoreductase n=1 Tax=Dactylosporangium vinaceum TaxID=53362 RepID=A0ABV5M5U9_9ACTN|nr:LLM class flavin-dependent oxidoreductase [Dactylosporangium vinaceum]UAC01263.1 LLM class flavin-dependent oxidoreductase [Dactylosporangium vinaceum]